MRGNIGSYKRKKSRIGKGASEPEQLYGPTGLKFACSSSVPKVRVQRSRICQRCALSSNLIGNRPSPAPSASSLRRNGLVPHHGGPEVSVARALTTSDDQRSCTSAHCGFASSRFTKLVNIRNKWTTTQRNHTHLNALSPAVAASATRPARVDHSR